MFILPPEQTTSETTVTNPVYSVQEDGMIVSELS